MTVTNKRFLALRASASVASSTRQRDVCMYASLWGDRWCGLHDSWIRVWWRHDEVLAVPSAYFVCLVVWPWVTNRSCDDVPGRSEQFLHCGCDGAGREQQPTSLLPTWGTKAHVQTDTHTHTDTLLTLLMQRSAQDMTNNTFGKKGRPSSVVIELRTVNPLSRSLI